MTEPLLRIGTFGTHLISSSTGFSFTGDVPSDIKVGSYPTEAQAIQAFATWFKEQDLEFQRQHVAELRNDVFSLVLAF